MRIEFSFSEFIRRMLPVHKRQTNRIKLYSWIFLQLQLLWEDYVIFRENAIFESNSTGQTISLEALLNRLVTVSNNKIYIQQVLDGGIYLSTATEDTAFIYLGLESETTEFEYITLEGEINTALSGVNFIVHIPATASKPQTAEIVNRYVVAGYIYSITQA